MTIKQYKKEYPYPKFWKYAETHWLYSKMPDLTMFVGICSSYFRECRYDVDAVKLSCDPKELHKLFEKCEKL